MPMTIPVETLDWRPTRGAIGVAPLRGRRRPKHPNREWTSGQWRA